MMLFLHVMGPMGGRTSTALCSLPAPVDVDRGQVQAAAAHWLAGLAGRLAVACKQSQALAVWWMESATARNGDVHLMSCSLLSMTAFLD